MRLSRERLLWYWAVTLVFAFGFHALLGYALDSGFGLIFSISFGVIPYLGMALIAPIVPSSRTLIGATALIALVDVATGMEAFFPSSSTAGIALFLPPIVGLVIFGTTLLIAIMQQWRMRSNRPVDTSDVDDSG